LRIFCVTTPSRFLVDTDAGVDDTLALFVLMQIAPPSVIDVAVTFGNVPLEQAMRNVGLLGFISGLVPRKVFCGSSGPLHGAAAFAADVHGVDGLGGVSRLPRWGTPPASPHEDLFTGVRLDAYQTVITLGPMTNIARLIGASSAPPPLFVMGGALEGGGNISPFAEFNFYSDPAAASEVVERYEGEIFLVPLDLCRAVVLRRAFLRELCERNGSPTGTFLNLIHQHYMDFYGRREGIDGCHPHDTLAVCAALKPDLFAWKRGRLRVLREGFERGRALFEPDAAGRHRVAQGVDAPRFFAMLERAIAAYTEPSL
jgi:uridine nucleosidase